MEEPTNKAILDAVITLSEKVDGLSGEVRGLSARVAELEKGAFTADEKRDVLALVRFIDERLEDEAGSRHVSLTQKESAKLMESVGLPNRLEKQ